MPCSTKEKSDKKEKKDKSEKKEKKNKKDDLSVLEIAQSLAAQKIEDAGAAEGAETKEQVEERHEAELRAVQVKCEEMLKAASKKTKSQVQLATYVELPCRAFRGKRSHAVCCAAGN
jgi:hypothetical protein